MTITATVNIAGDSAGMKSVRRVEHISTAGGDEREEREHDAGEIDRQFDLPGHFAEVRREQAHERRRKNHPHDDDRTRHENEGVDDRAGEAPRAFAAFECELPCECRHKRRAHGTLGKEVADEVGDSARDAEGVVGVAGAEVIRDDLVPGQPENAARDGRQPENPGGAGQAWWGVGHQLEEA